MEIYVGEAAYQFCLEVICGLRSPLVGETEVMGQFKMFLDCYKGESTFDELFRKFAHSLLGDAKRIRNKFLKDLGSQSYGGLARRWVKDSSEVHILGYGHLAQEMIPWLTKGETQVHVYVRSPKRVKQPSVKLHDFNQRNLIIKGALILAAPMSNAEIEAWLQSHDARFQTIIDMRETSRTQPLELAVQQYCSLQDAFDLVEKGREKRQIQAKMARAAIREIAQERCSEQMIRPFGWEDLENISDSKSPKS